MEDVGLGKGNSTHQSERSPLRRASSLLVLVMCPLPVQVEDQHLAAFAV